MQEPKRIAFLGECMVELRGQPFDAVKASFGGDTLNSALYCSRISKDTLQTFYVTALGEDGFSEAMLNAWQAEGIHTSLVQRFSEHQPGMYAVVLDDKGERSFCYWRSQSAARYLMQHPNITSVVEQLRSFSCLVFSGISLAILHDREKFIAMLSELRTQGVQIVFDTNFRPTLWEDIAEARHWCARALSHSDVALVTFDDEKLLWGDASPEETRNRLHAAGVKTLVVKLGEDGAVFSDGSSSASAALTSVPAKKVESVCDTTAAGDAFNAGFLAAYLNGESMEASCKQGHQVASKVIQYPGAIIPKSVGLLS